MKGIYVNTEANHTLFDDAALGTYLRTQDFQLGSHKVIVKYHDELSVFQSDEFTVILFGWVYSDNMLIDAEAMLLKYQRNCLNDIDSGRFVTLIFHRATDELVFISDPFALSCHYISRAEGIQLAPTLTVFHNKIKEQEWFLFRQEHGHLVGDKTIYKNIFRLSPGSVNSARRCEPYCDLTSQEKRLEVQSLHSEMARLVSAWPRSSRVSPVTSGFDSRFITSSAKFQWGYTYGTKDSTDRRIGKQISGNCEHYFQFDEQAIDTTVRSNADSFMFEQDIDSGLANYAKARMEIVNDAPDVQPVLFDGYLGDGLQRVSYLKLGGLLGALFLLVPALYSLKLSSRFILKRRYKKLSQASLELLYQELDNVTQGKNLDEYQKVIFFEALYGRGARWIINGGNISCSQYFTVCSPFAHRKIFSTFLHQNLEDVAKYKNMKALWKNADLVFKSTPTESGISPDSAPFTAPFKRVFNAIKR